MFVINCGCNTRRKSILNIEMDNKKIKSLEIRVGGPAVMISKGTMMVPEK